MTNTETAGRWFRVSTGGQDEVNQEPEVNRHLGQHGYAEGPTYRLQGESASKGDQDPYVAQVIADAKAGKLTVLVAWHVDRLDRRGPWATGLMIQALNRAGVRVETTDGGEVSDRDLNGLVKQWSAREESEHKSRRIKAKQAHLRSIGSWCNGKAPYGYRIIKTDDGRKTLTAVPHEAETVLRVFELAAVGLSCIEISKALTGTPTRLGIDVWQAGTISQLLRQDVYRGIVNGPDGRPYMTVPAVVSGAQFTQARDAIDGKTRGRGERRNNGRGGGAKLAAYLRPVCGRCGSVMYRYGVSYRCAGQSAQRQACSKELGGRQYANTIRVDVLDAAIAAEFAASEERDWIDESIPAADYSEQIATVRLAIRDLDDMASDYDERHAQLRAELRGFVTAQERADAEGPTKQGHFGEMIGVLFQRMSRDEQSAFIRENSRIVVKPGDVSVTGRWAILPRP